MRTEITLLSVAALSGCASFHNVESNTLTPPQIAAPDAWQSGEMAEVPPTGDWISSFNSTILDDLVLEALSNNPNLAISAARVKSSRASAEGVYGNTLPSVNAGADAGWASTVLDINDDAVRNEAPSFGLSLGANWEPDLWGRLASGVAAAEADIAASKADFAATQLSIAASTVISWIQLNEAIRQEELANQNLSAREGTLRLTERRFRNGLSGALDVRLARSSVESAKAGASARERTTGESRRSIEVLLGRYPANELEASATDFDLAPLEGDAGDPTSLLARRPDIHAAEARIAAAGFRVDQARAALRPSLALSASLSTSNTDLEDVFDPSFIAGRVAGALTAPIFNGGALKANIEVAQAQAEIAANTYVATVLSAWQEVENAIAADALLADQVASQSRALEEAQLAEDLAERQYQNGLTTIFNLIDAQTSRINAESNLISAQSARAINRVNFHLALGGNLPMMTERVTALSEETNL